MARYVIIEIKTNEDSKSFLEDISKIFPTGVIPPKANQPFLGWVEDTNYNALSYITHLQIPSTPGYFYQMRVMTMGKQKLAPHQTLLDLEVIAGRHLFNILKASKKYSVILSIDYEEILEQFDPNNS